MSESPRLEVIPAKSACRTDQSITLDVLISVVPPALPPTSKRPQLNLGLVLDRSGSMNEKGKMEYAREAAIFAVQQLLATDRVSVTIFDENVEVIAPNAPVADKAGLVQRIQQVHPRGSTDLHGGWTAGAQQTVTNLVSGGINRVLLLTDGLANHGITTPDTITGHVARQRSEGVSTTTLGVGIDYNEKLLESMARAGDGNYYFIESPVQLPKIFATELTELAATIGTAVSLGIEPTGGAQVEKVLNGYDQLPNGRYKLPTLIAGNPVQTIVRLTIPAQSTTTEVCKFRVAWDTATNGRQVQTISLTLPAIAGPAWESLAPDVTVSELTTLLEVAQLKREAAARMEARDHEGARAYMSVARQVLACAAPSARMEDEKSDFDALAADLEEKNCAVFTKKAAFQSHRRGHSKPRPEETT